MNEGRSEGVFTKSSFSFLYCFLPTTTDFISHIMIRRYGCKKHGLSLLKTVPLSGKGATVITVLKYIYLSCFKKEGLNGGVLPHFTFYAKRISVMFTICFKKDMR